MSRWVGLAVVTLAAVFLCPPSGASLTSVDDLQKLDKMLELISHHNTHHRRQPTTNEKSLKYGSEPVALEWMTSYNNDLANWRNRAKEANWAYATNVTDYNAAKYSVVDVDFAKWLQKESDEANKYHVYVNRFRDPDLVRMLTLINLTSSTSPRDDKKLQELSDLGNQLKTIYATATITSKDGVVMHLEPEIGDVISTSRDWAELEAAWVGWHDAAGMPMRDPYAKYINISTNAVKKAGFKDISQAWMLSCYEETDIEEIADGLWKQLQPLYQQLHAYVRRKLRAFYTDHEARLPPDGPIPIHITGNMWGQEWQNLADLIVPYPEVPVVDVTAELKKQNYTAERMFRLAEDYFYNIGLNKMTPLFWEKSMIVKPDDGRDVECHGSAHDMFSPGDFRIKMCTQIDKNYLYVVHHEMGHVEYFMQYENQYTTYRTGANCAFHEAVGDTIGLMVNTPEHLAKVGLLKEKSQPTDDEKNVLNNQMRVALEKLPLLPFALSLEKWRYGVFRGTITERDYNTQWWRLRHDYAGLAPPVPRNETMFDPGAKYHIPADVPYMRYFLSFVVQFQFHKALCDTAGEGDPIYRCDIYATDKAKDAGKKLGDMLAMGASKPWRDALETLTGTRHFDANALLDFFKPLHDWLKVENKGSVVGWS